MLDSLGVSFCGFIFLALMDAYICVYDCVGVCYGVFGTACITHFECMCVRVYMCAFMCVGGIRMCARTRAGEIDIVL